MTTDPSSPQVVASDLNEIEAYFLVDYLKENGFDAQLWGTPLAGVYGEGVPRFCVQVIVRHSEADLARTAIETYRRSDD